MTGRPNEARQRTSLAAALHVASEQVGRRRRGRQPMVTRRPRRSRRFGTASRVMVRTLTQCGIRFHWWKAIQRILFRESKRRTVRLRKSCPVALSVMLVSLLSVVRIMLLFGFLNVYRHRFDVTSMGGIVASAQLDCLVNFLGRVSERRCF